MIPHKFNAGFTSGLGYIGDDAAKEAFIPSYGGPAPTGKQPTTGMRPKSKSAFRKYLPWAGAALGAAALIFAVTRK